MGEVEELEERQDVALERVPSVEESDQPKPLPLQLPKVSARTITGPANLQNQGAIDWGHHGLLAYGSNYTVVVVDTKNVQPIQCLDKHKSMVHKVLWDKYHHTISLGPDPPPLELVSSDATGHIIVWDVVAGSPKAVLQEGNRPVLDMEWVPSCEGSMGMLVALHPPYSVVVWDTRNRSKLWKKTYTETLVSFNFDPFCPSKMAFLCTDCILFVDDFTLARVPSSNGRKFYVSSPRNSAVGARGSVTNLTSVGAEEKHRARDRLRRLMKELVVGEMQPRPDDQMTVSEALQLQYHCSLRHHLLLVYAREALLLDLHINQTVGIVTLERSASPLMQVISSRQRDVLYCLHESGSVSAKLRRRQLGIVGSPLDAPAGSISSLDTGSFNADVFMEMSYEQRCQSEGIRQSKGSRVLGMALHPVTENRIALLVSTGKLVFLELRPCRTDVFPLIPSPGLLQEPLKGGSKIVQPGDTLSDILAPLMSDIPAPPLRLLVTGLLTPAACPLTVIRMCPPLTTRNWQQYRPLMAAGTTSGVIQVFNMATGVVEKELSIHSYSVRGIEWANLHSFLSFAFPNVAGASGTVRNELILTDYRTGHSVALRTDKAEEVPIDLVRVSPLKQYFVVVLKDGPVELWDLRNLCMLRTMPRRFPAVTALEWSPIHNLKALRRRLASVEEKEQAEPTNLATSTPVGDINRAEGSDKQLVAREHFVFSDSESQLYHFSVEGNTVHDGIKIPPETGVGTVTCIAFKNEQIVQGDVDGMLNLWDLRARTSRNIHTGRGWVKKVRFAPGKGNMKLLVLYSDGVDVVDLRKKTYERVSQLRCPKDMVKVLDVDWAASDKPVLATVDGCLRVMDLGLDATSSPLCDYEFQDPIFCPALLPTAVAENLRMLLSGQFWRGYTLELGVSDGFTGTQLAEIQQLMSSLDPEQLNYLCQCPLGTPQRSLMVARILGDQEEVDFWTVALYYLQCARLDARHSKVEQSPERTPSPRREPPRHPELAPLDTCYDVVCDAHSYQRLQLERAGVHEAKRGDHLLTRQVVQTLILLGETDRAVQLLLETDLEHPAYYTDAIKACLVATIPTTGAAQSTVKLVATNLIAHGDVWEGVQLLCLLGKALDACRYLLSLGRWGAAVWLARASLPPEGGAEVLRRWADHLASSGRKAQAALVLLSLGHWGRVLELLGAQRLHGRAGLLLQSCREFGLPKFPEPLHAAVQLDFARHLSAVGNLKAALEVARGIEPAADALVQELEILAAENMD